MLKLKFNRRIIAVLVVLSVVILPLTPSLCMAQDGAAAAGAAGVGGVFGLTALTFAGMVAAVVAAVAIIANSLDDDATVPATAHH